jgi:glyoxylase-like metal-dependent hydrolase (beta-lactamase superfamily II)
MKIFNPIQVNEHIYQIRVVGCRVTLIINQKEICLVDIGYPGSYRLIKSGIESLGFSINDISSLVLTHYHPDHIGDIKSILENIDPLIFAHKDEIRAISGLDPDIKASNNEAISSLYKRTKTYLTLPKLINKISPLIDGDKLTFPTPIKIIHLPGHTKGSIGLYLPNDDAAVVGDALTYKFGKNLGFASSLYSEDMSLVKKSAIKLSELNLQMILFSHYPPIKTDAKHSLKHLVTTSLKI